MLYVCKCANNSGGNRNESIIFTEFLYLSNFFLFVLCFLSNKSQEQKFVLHNKCCLACGVCGSGSGGQEAARCKVLGVS